MRINLKSDQFLLGVGIVATLAAIILLLTMPPAVNETITPVATTKTGSTNNQPQVESTDTSSDPITATVSDATTSDTGTGSSAKSATPAAEPVTRPTPAVPNNSAPLPPAPVQPFPGDTRTPDMGCDLNGLVFVPRGGNSCSYTISTVDGSVTDWYLPALYAFANGGAAEKPNAPVYVVIETPGITPGQPFAASSITFHYASLWSATLGDYNDGSNGLAFMNADTGEIYTQSVTVTVQ
jgi:hypothetical protein